MIFGDEVGLKSDFIAQSVGTNPVVIRRLLGQLKSAGLVSTKLGPNGGSFLVNDPKMIRLSEVYNIVEEGNLFHMHYSSPNEVCPVGAHIQEDLVRVLNQAEESFKGVLEKETLFNMVNGIFEKIASYKEMSKEELASEWEKTMQNMKN